jgi:ParB family chromosome partitioning protein
VTAAAAVAAQGEVRRESVQMVRLEELEPSPFNTRVIVEDDAMRGLVESIRTRGIQQPLICREVPIEGEIVKFEIVAGHRRFFAGGLAGLEAAPVIFRELTDDQARELQIVENLQRADLPPLEEARAFNEAMTFADGKMLDVQTLAARLGKSPVYINRRLTLLDAIAPVQEALSKRLIDVGHALELARLSEAEQLRLLYWLGVVEETAEDDPDEDEDEDEDGEDDLPGATLDSIGDEVTTKSLPELRKYIASTTLRVLGAAPFNPNDALLIEEAGSCADCLKRSGSSPLLFNDVAGDDVCTDRSCFDDKVKAFIARAISEAKAAGRQLDQITTEHSKKGKQVHLSWDVTRAGDKQCEFTVEAIYIDGGYAGKTIGICVNGKCPVHHSYYRNEPKESPEKAKAKRKALLAKVKVEKAYRLQLLKEMLAKPLPELPTDEMVRELVLFAFTRIDSTKHEQFAEALGWEKDIFGWRGEKSLKLKLMACNQADAIRIALVGLEANELTLHEQEIGNKRELGLEKIAKLIGVDAGKVRQAVDPDAVKPKPAAKKAPAKKAAKAAAKKAPAKKAPAKKAAKAAAKKAPAKKAAKKKAVKG